MRHVKSVSVVRPVSAIGEGFCSFIPLEWCKTCAERGAVPVIGPIWEAVSPICWGIWDRFPGK